MNMHTINITTYTIHQESGCFNLILALAETGGRIKMLFKSCCETQRPVGIHRNNMFSLYVSIPSSRSGC